MMYWAFLNRSLPGRVYAMWVDLQCRTFNQSQLIWFKRSMAGLVHLTLYIYSISLHYWVQMQGICVVKLAGLEEFLKLKTHNKYQPLISYCKWFVIMSHGKKNILVWKGGLVAYFFFQASGPWLKTVFCGWAIHTHLYPYLLPTGVYLTPSLFPWPFSPAHWFKSCNQQTGQHYLQVKKQSKWSYWLSVWKCCFWLSCSAHFSLDVICLFYDYLA